MNQLIAILLNSQPEVPAGAGGSIELTLWKWVVIIGAGAIVAFWVIKRFSEIFIKHKTDALVRSVGEADDASDSGEHKTD